MDRTFQDAVGMVAVWTGAVGECDLQRANSGQVMVREGGWCQTEQVGESAETSAAVAALQ